MISKQIAVKELGKHFNFKFSGEPIIDPKRMIMLKDMETSPNTNEFLKELVTIFCRDTPEIIRAIGTAIENADNHLACQLSHRLKGYSYNLGAMKLAALANYLEINFVGELLKDDIQLIKSILGEIYTEAENELISWL